MLIVLRLVHPPKAHSDTLLTFEGRTMSVNDEQYAKHPNPIEVSVSGRVTFCSLEQLIKAHEERVVIVFGIVIDVIELPWKAPPSADMDV